VIAGGGDIVEGEYVTDTWDATVLGIAARRGHTLAHFGVIRQLWLREAIKRWSRFRLGAGYAFGTIAAGAESLARWSMFLRERPQVRGPADITRELLESFLSWMASSKWSANIRSHTLTFTKVFLEWGHRHNTLPGLPVNAVIYEEEVSRPPDSLPQFISEFVMAQLESDSNLARLRNPTVRHLVIVLMETGIRGGRCVGVGVQPDHRGQRRGRLPTFREHQSRSRATHPDQRQSRDGHSRSTGPCSVALAARFTVAVPRTHAEQRRNQALRPPVSPTNSVTGRKPSTYATNPGNVSGFTLISSDILSAPGSSTPVFPNT
jgi:hypothetical protein